MAGDWFYAKEGAQYGPVPSSELQRLASAGQLLKSDLVWRDGLRDWITAENVQGLSFTKSSGTPPPIPPSPAPGTSDPLRKCPFCSEMIADGAVKCRYCQSLLVPMNVEVVSARMIAPTMSPHDPLLMAILSGCCIAGLGQIVLGQVTKGVVCLIGAFTLALLSSGVSAILTWPLLGIDAFLVAKKLKSGRPVAEWECFPT